MGVDLGPHDLKISNKERLVDRNTLKETLVLNGKEIKKEDVDTGWGVKKTSSVY